MMLHIHFRHTAYRYRAVSFNLILILVSTVQKIVFVYDNFIKGLNTPFGMACDHMSILIENVFINSSFVSNTNVY